MIFPKLVRTASSLPTPNLPTLDTCSTKDGKSFTHSQTLIPSRICFRTSTHSIRPSPRSSILPLPVCYFGNVLAIAYVWLRVRNEVSSRVWARRKESAQNCGRIGAIEENANRSAHISSKFRPGKSYVSLQQQHRPHTFTLFVQHNPSYTLHFLSLYVC